MPFHKSTKIVATLGPASSREEVIAAMAEGGADVFRLNFSHGGHEEQRERYRAVRAIEEKLGRPLGILMDLQGPKLRIGSFREGKVRLEPGQTFRLDLDPEPGD